GGSRRAAAASRDHGRIRSRLHDHRRLQHHPPARRGDSARFRLRADQRVRRRADAGDHHIDVYGDYRDPRDGESDVRRPIAHEAPGMSQPIRVINFMGLRTYGAIFSILVMLISIGSLATRGLNFGLDFTGGTLVEVQFVNPVVAEDVRVTLADAGIHEAVAQHFGSERDVLVRVPPQKGESEALLADHLRNALTAQYEGVQLRCFESPASSASAPWWR